MIGFDRRINLRHIFLIIALLSIIQSCSSIDGTRLDDWKTSESFHALGLNILIYFNPLPGNISADLEKINGIISIQGEFQGQQFLITILTCGTLHQDEYVNTSDFQPVSLNSSMESYTEQIPLYTPSKGSFTVFMIINFSWTDSNSIIEDKTVKIAADYQKRISTDFDLATIIIPGGIVILGILMIWGIGVIQDYIKTPIFTNAQIKDKLTEIDKYIKNFNLQIDDLPLIEINTINPGMISLLEKKKELLLEKIEKMQPKLKELENITQKEDIAKQPVLNNDLFRYISSNFIRASRKRENLPLDEIDAAHIQLLRETLQRGSWEELKDIYKTKLAWQVCNNHLNAMGEKEKIYMPQNLENEAQKLSILISQYNTIKNSIIWPPDRPLILSTEKELQADLAIIHSKIDDVKTWTKNEKKIFKKKSNEAKKRIHDDFKWLGSVKSQIDDDSIPQLLMKLKNMETFIKNDINYVS